MLLRGTGSLWPHHGLAVILSFGLELLRSGAKEMRLRWRISWFLALSLSTCSAQPVADISVSQLVRETVYNELQEHERQDSWRYWIESNTQKNQRTEEQVETADGPVTRLLESDGSALTPAAEKREQARLNHLLHSPLEQALLRQKYIDSEARIGRILGLLPDAFLFEDAGEGSGCHRLRFRPSPNYVPHSIEARILHAMSGELCIDTRFKRLVRLDGHLDDDVELGFGILGRLYKGGWCRLKRIQVSPADWETEQIEVHLSGRAMLLKGIDYETSEVRGGFIPVPPRISFAEGILLLGQTQPRVQHVATSTLESEPASLPAAR